MPNLKAFQHRGFQDAGAFEVRGELEAVIDQRIDFEGFFLWVNEPVLPDTVLFVVVFFVAPVAMQKCFFCKKKTFNNC